MSDEKRETPMPGPDRSRPPAGCRNAGFDRSRTGFHSVGCLRVGDERDACLREGCKMLPDPAADGSGEAVEIARLRTALERMVTIGSAVEARQIALAALTPPLSAPFTSQAPEKKT